MDRVKMESYLSNKQRLKELEEKIERKRKEPDCYYADVVKGSSPDFPYTEHPIKISGYNINDPERKAEQINKLIVKLDTLRCDQVALKQEIEDYIDSQADPQLRRILALKYLDGFTYNKIARLIGGGNSADAVKKRVQRFLKD